MAEPLSSTSVSSIHLTGSQIETYQTLLTMGFAASEAVNVAEIFGSNVQGAIDCLFNGGAPAVSAPAVVQNLIRCSPKPKMLRFRTTSLSHQFTNGYIRKHSDYVVPSVINDLIIHYSNLYFIKLNYNIRNDDDMEQKYTENTSIFVTECDTTLREIAIKIEKTTPYTYKDAMNVQPQYSYFVHIWIRFRFLKPIYPLKNSKININIDDINACECANNCDPNRWIEIPNDFEEIKISEMDTLLTATAKDKHAVLELGIEKFNPITKKWPFRNANMTPTSLEIAMLRPLPEKQLKLKDPNMVPKTDKLKSSPCDGANDCTGFEFQIGDYITLKDDRKGIIRCIGSTGILSGILVGIELDEASPEGHDGRFLGMTYFECRQGHGIFVGADDVKKKNSIARSTSKLCTEAIRSDSHGSKTISQALVTNKPNPSSSLDSLPTATCDTIPILTQLDEETDSIVADSWEQHLAVGDIIEVKDDKDKWYESVIRCMNLSEGKKTMLYLHYIGWNNRWDESILAEDKKRIAKRGTHTDGPHRPTKRTLNSNTPSLIYPYYRKYVNEAARHK